MSHHKREAGFLGDAVTAKRSKAHDPDAEAVESEDNLNTDVSAGNQPLSVETNGQNGSNFRMECNDSQIAEESSSNDAITGSTGAFSQHETKLTCIEADAAEDKGCRHVMEDAWVVLPDASLEYPGNLRCSHFAIYDGHGGRLAAEFAQKHLHANILAAGLPRGYQSYKEGNR